MTKRAFGSLRQLPRMVNGKPGKGGRWQAHYTGPDGVRYKAPKTFAAKVDAEAWLTDRRREIDRGLWTVNTAAPERPLFATYADEWLRTRTVGGRPLKTTTRQHYQLILDSHLTPAFGGLRLDAITSAAVKQWYADLLPEAPTMRSRVYSLLRTILTTAVEDEHIATNPCRIRGAGTVRRAGRTVPATPEELAAIADAIEPRELRCMVLLAGWCGLRFGELIELRRSDVEIVRATADGDALPEALIRVRRSATYNAAIKRYAAGSTKSEAGARDVHVPPHIVGEVAEHLDTLTGIRPSAKLFEHPDTGGYLTPHRLYRSYYPAREKAGRADLRFHDLRHTGATLAAMTGASLAELQARLGHSTVAAAMRYQHAVAGRDREIAAALSALAGE